MTERARDVPGGDLLGAWPAVAASALAFNVYVLRPHHPGIISGKLSDLAINFLLPLFIVAAIEWMLAAAAFVARRPRRQLSVRELRLACVLSGAYFALLQIAPGFVQIHARIATVLDIPFGGQREFARNVADLLDLLTLVTTVLAARYLERCRAATSHLGERHEPDDHAVPSDDALV